jgi:hypothetical protein
MSTPAVETDMPTILKNARALRLILEAAELRGLPMPFAACASDYAEVRLQFMTRDQVVTWAETLEADVEDGMHVHATGVSDTTHARGEWLDVPLEISCHAPRGAA